MYQRRERGTEAPLSEDHNLITKEPASMRVRRESDQTGVASGLDLSTM
jgi:hypothetical protein